MVAFDLYNLLELKSQKGGTKMIHLPLLPWHFVGNCMLLIDLKRD